LRECSKSAVDGDSGLCESLAKLRALGMTCKCPDGANVTRRVSHSAADLEDKVGGGNGGNDGGEDQHGLPVAQPHFLGNEVTQSCAQGKADAGAAERAWARGRVAVGGRRAPQCSAARARAGAYA
jgi:hypothetical protein